MPSALARAVTLALCFAMLPPHASAQSGPLIIRTRRLLDGTGGTRMNTDIEIVNGRITALRPAMGPLPKGAIDLRSRTVLPGLIDTHVHIGWYVNSADRLHTETDGDTPATQVLSQAGNAWVTLRAGFTTVQSLGATIDGPVRDLIRLGRLPGPRVLSSLRQINENTGDPEKIRELVRQVKQEGGDVVKLFATKSIRDGGAQSMTDAQIQAACGEAKAQGLRSVVHAHASEGAKAARGSLIGFRLSLSRCCP